MSHGNLEGKLVAADFWPACENCRLSETCKDQPRHPAYPHTWHWGREFAVFTESALILRSWVGTAEIGQPHTGCQSYTVDPQYVAAPLPHHQSYLAFERERQELSTKLERLERDGALTEETTRLYAQLFQRFSAIIEEQRVIRIAMEPQKPAAA